MIEQAEALAAMGAKAVLLKGGHAQTRDASDVMVSKGQSPKWFRAPFIETKNTHGTGCSLSSAIAAGLAQGKDLETAISTAKEWLSGAIAAADKLNVGNGAGPVHHFHAFWDDTNE